MIFAASITSHAKLAEFFNGTELARGSAGTNSAGSPNLQDLTTDAFAGLSAGDRIYISGEASATVFLIQTKTDANNIVLDNNIVAAHTADAVWRAVTAPTVTIADVKEFIPDPAGNKYVVLYERDTFAN